MIATIVVLDAEPVVRSVITKILQREGYTVLPVSDLDSAADAVRHCTPDLLITNLYLPGTTGHEAARLLRKTCPNIRVLMVAGLPDDRSVCDRAEDEDFDLFPKPFAADDLAAKVRDALKPTTPSDH